MFTFAATPVTFVGLLVLFAWCVVWCGYELTRPQDGRQRVSNVLHLAMGVVMLLMVAPPTWQALTGLVPTPALVGVFVLATAWFGWLATEGFRASDPRGGRHFAGHAAMFAAMAWHLSAMATMASGMSGMSSGGMSGHDMGGMGGMEMGGAGSAPVDPMEWMATASRPGGVLWVFALVGLPLMAYLLGATVVEIRAVARPRAAVNDACACGAGCTCGPDCACSTSHALSEAPERELVLAGAPAPTRVEVAPAALAHSCHEVRPVGSRTYRLAALADVAMNGGMFWMSAGLLVPVLPFLAVLAV